MEYNYRVQCSVSGREIRLFNEFNSTRPLRTTIRQSTTVEEILLHVSRCLPWPPTYIVLRAGDMYVRYYHRIVEQTRTRILDLDMTGTSESQPFIIQVTLLPPPEDFSNSYAGCLCNFGGCCRACNVPGSQVCWGCGNTGCCRCGNCGHTCCEGIVQRRAQGAVCPLSGCVPSWVSDERPDD